MKILIVDDEPLVRAALSRALLKMDHQVKEAVDGVEGERQWREWGPDLVFLDVLMPKKTGPELLQSGVQELRACKVVLMSAFGGEWDLEKARYLGADLFIAKPFENIFATVEQGVNLVNERTVR